MSTTPEQIRSAISTQVGTTTLSVSGTLVESIFPYLFFRDAERSPRHLEYAVGIGTSEAIGDRQRAGGTVLVRSAVNVIVAVQLVQNAPEITTALAVENDIRKHLHENTPSYPATFSIMWKRSDRTALGLPGWVAVESVFDCIHYMLVS